MEGDCCAICCTKIFPQLYCFSCYCHSIKCLHVIRSCQSLQKTKKKNMTYKHQLIMTWKQEVIHQVSFSYFVNSFCKKNVNCLVNVNDELYNWNDNVGEGTKVGQRKFGCFLFLMLFSENFIPIWKASRNESVHFARKCKQTIH